jgi:hypothetical protein
LSVESKESNRTKVTRKQGGKTRRTISRSTSGNPGRPKVVQPGKKTEKTQVKSRSQNPRRKTSTPAKAKSVRTRRKSNIPRPRAVQPSRGQGRRSKGTPSDLRWVEEDPKDHLLSRFIFDGKGNIIGESIGVDGKYLIMKSGKKFYSVPLKNIREDEKDLTLKGKIDKRMARKLGEVWRKKALDPLYQKDN